MTSPWPQVRIDSVGEVQAGRQRSASIVDGELRPYLRVANVFDGFIDYGDVLTMPFSEREVSTYSLRPGDILLNEGQSLKLVGRSAIYDGPKDTYCFQNTLIRFRASDAIIPEFGRHVFHHMHLSGVFATIASRTTSIAHLGVERFASLCIPLPPLAEQRTIARVLSAWDRGIRLLTDLLVAKIHFKQGLIQRMFSGMIRFRGFSSHAHSHPRLGEVLEKVSDLVCLIGDEMYREIGLRSHGKGIFHKAPVYGRSLGNKRVYRVIPGCLTLNIVFAWERALGVTTEREAGMIASHRFPMFRPDPNRVLAEYVLLYLLSTSKGNEALELASPGGAGRNRTLSQTTFLKTQLPLPSLEEQRKIVTFVRALDQETVLLRNKLEAFKQQKKGLMQKLLTGEVRVKLPEEVA